MNTKPEHIIITILTVALIVGILATSSFDERQENFLTEYTIATNYIDSVIFTQKIVEINYNYYTDFIQSPDGYYYDDVEGYLDGSLSQSDESLEILEKSKVKLESIKLDSPNDFFDKELVLRLEQIELLKQSSIKRIEMIELTNDELYEVNFGSMEKATLIYEENNIVIEDFNDLVVREISKEQEIDIHWMEDFYAN
jgi:hypothetical protein